MSNCLLGPEVDELSCLVERNTLHCSALVEFDQVVVGIKKKLSKLALVKHRRQDAIWKRS